MGESSLRRDTKTPHYALRRFRVPTPARADQPRNRAAAPLLCALRAFRAGPRELGKNATVP